MAAQISSTTGRMAGARRLCWCRLAPITSGSSGDGVDDCPPARRRVRSGRRCPGRLGTSNWVSWWRAFQPVLEVGGVLLDGLDTLVCSCVGAAAFFFAVAVWTASRLSGHHVGIMLVSRGRSSWMTSAVGQLKSRESASSTDGGGRSRAASRRAVNGMYAMLPCAPAADGPQCRHRAPGASSSALGFSSSLRGDRGQVDVVDASRRPGAARSRSQRAGAEEAEVEVFELSTTKRARLQSWRRRASPASESSSCGVWCSPKDEAGRTRTGGSAPPPN